MACSPLVYYGHYYEIFLKLLPQIWTGTWFNFIHSLFILFLTIRQSYFISSSAALQHPVTRWEMYFSFLFVGLLTMQRLWHIYIMFIQLPWTLHLRTQFLGHLFLLFNDLNKISSTTLDPIPFHKLLHILWICRHFCLSVNFKL